MTIYAPHRQREQLQMYQARLLELARSLYQAGLSTQYIMDCSKEEVLKWIKTLGLPPPDLSWDLMPSNPKRLHASWHLGELADGQLLILDSGNEEDDAKTK